MKLVFRRQGFSKSQAVAVFAGAILFSHFVWANDCKSLSVELDQMAKAQKIIMGDLVSNHEQFSNHLEEIANEMTINSSSKSNAKTVLAMKQIAKAYKKRGTEAARLTEDLNEATADLVARTKACLKK